ncbi:hypothetical protein Tco_0200080 [Tanacetum coccineum]
MSFVAFRDIIKHLVHAPVASLYYCKVGTPLRVGITTLKNDADVDDFVNLCYQNKWVVDLYIEHNGYDALDIRDQSETLVHDEGNESSDAYYSSDDEDLRFVDFHTESYDNVVIKTFSTDDPFLNKLCSNNGHFRGFIDEHVNANVERVVEDTKSIDPKFNVKQGVTYLRHDPTHDWNEIEPLLGMSTWIAFGGNTYDFGSFGEETDKTTTLHQITDNQEKDEKQSQNDKTELGMEKTVKDKAKSKPESQSSQKVNRKVNWSKSKSTPKPKSQQTKKYKFKG